MKTSVLLALIGASSAVKISEPTSVCQNSGQPGVTCTPAAGGSFFANGMVGHEDLEKDIVMKNIDYHFAQNGHTNNFANGMVGHEDLKKDIVMKNIDYHYAQQSRSGNGKDDGPSCGCGSSLCEACNKSLAQAGPVAADGYTDQMGYSKYVHPYFPGTTTPNFRIQQGGKCLEWNRDGNTGNDQHTIAFQACQNNNHQQWFNFHQMSRTIRAYSRNNFVITNREGQNWNGASYDAVLRPWRKDNYNIVDFANTAKCTIMNLDGPNGYALTNNNGNLVWQVCTGAANQKFTISPFEPGNGSYPAK